MKTRRGKDIFDVYKVFTPSTPARATFIERQSVNDKLVEALRTPGKQIIIYGHSGSGKTTLLINKLEQTYEKYIITRCMAGMNFENLLMHGFAELDRYYIDKVDKSLKKKAALQIGTEYGIIKAQLTGEAEKTETVSVKPILPPLLTAQFLVKFYGELNCCWVLEDFHKISSSEKDKAAQIMKVFVDSALDYQNVKLVAIGAVNTGRDVVNYDSEMKRRISQIRVPLMLESELSAIIESGEDRLFIRFDNAVKAAIIRASSGLASICHQLCLNCCVHQGVIETSESLIRMDEATLYAAFEMYVEDNEDSLKQDYEDAIKLDGGVEDMPEIILSTIAKYKSEDVPYKVIVKKIENKFMGREKYLSGLSLTELMLELQQDGRGAVLVYNNKTESYSFANPFMKVFVQCMFKGESDDSNYNEDKFTDVLIMQMVDRVHKIFYEGSYYNQDDDDDISDDFNEILVR